MLGGKRASVCETLARNARARAKITPSRVGFSSRAGGEFACAVVNFAHSTVPSREMRECVRK